MELTHTQIKALQFINSRPTPVPIGAVPGLNQADAQYLWANKLIALQPNTASKVLIATPLGKAVLATNLAAKPFVTTATTQTAQANVPVVQPEAPAKQEAAIEQTNVPDEWGTQALSKFIAKVAPHKAVLPPRVVPAAPVIKAQPVVSLPESQATPSTRTPAIRPVQLPEPAISPTSLPDPFAIPASAGVEIGALPQPTDLEAPDPRQVGKFFSASSSSVDDIRGTERNRPRSTSYYDPNSQL